VLAEADEGSVFFVGEVRGRILIFEAWHWRK
jgi:hypothetical protein